MLCYGLLCVSCVDIIEKLRVHVVSESIIFFFASFLLGLWYFRSALFYHYLMLCVPFFPILVILSKQICSHHRCLSVFYKVVMVTILVFPILFLCIKYPSMIRNIDKSTSIDYISEEISEYIPETEIKSLVAYDIPPSLYLKLNIKPLYRNFSFPETQSIKSEKLRNDIILEYSSCKAKWIVTSDNEDMLISTILEKNYTLEHRSSSCEGLSIWRRAD